MPFKKGHHVGRPKGAKNKDDLNSLRILLQECFHDNRVAIKRKISAMLGEDTSEMGPLELKVYLQEFTEMLKLKASLEPKMQQITGKDGEDLDFTPPQIIIMKHVSGSLNKPQEEIAINRVTVDEN